MGVDTLWFNNDHLFEILPGVNEREDHKSGDRIGDGTRTRPDTE